MAHRKLWIRFLIFILVLVWYAGIFSSCLSRIDSNILKFYPFIKQAYSTVCHQNSEKVIHTSCGTTLVCARCTGIYSGVFLISFISIITPFRKAPHIKYLYYAALPMLFDVISTTMNLYNYSKTIAFLTGLFFGSVLFLYFYRSVITLFQEIFIQGLK